MSTQLFKKIFDLEDFVNFLSTICDVKDNEYTFNNDAFKKANLFNRIDPFVEKCKDHYYLSKHKYLNRKITYKTFITILRQIAKSINIEYSSNIKYSKSNYNIEYVFLINDANDKNKCINHKY